MTERGAVGRLFHTFANAVLARTLPTVREWLASKLGPHASVDKMELDGSRVHLLDARLPIGPTAVLEVDRATFAARMGEGPPLGLESLEGRLVVPDGESGPRFVAPMTLAGQPPATGLEWVHGIVTVTDARWSASAGRDEQSPLSGTITVSVTSSDWALTDGRATAGDATVEISGAGRLDDPERGLERAFLGAKDARVGHFLDALFALAGRDNVLQVPLPWTGRCDGQIAVEGDRVDANFDVQTEASRLAIEARVDAGVVAESKLQGRVAWSDLVPENWASWLSESDSVMLDGGITGPFDALEGTLSLRCDNVRTRLLRDAAHLSAEVDAGASSLQAQLSIGAVEALRIHAAQSSEGLLQGSVRGQLDPSVLDLSETGLGQALLAGTPVVVEGTLGGHRTQPVVSVEARSERLELAHEGESVALSDLRLDTGLDDGPRARLEGSLGEGVLRADLIARTLSASRIDAPTVVSVARFGGADWLRRGSEPEELALLALPDGAELALDLTYRERVEGSVQVVTPRSEIAIEPLVLEPREWGWEGSVLRGRLAASDALTCGLFPSPFRPTPEGSATLELNMAGAGVDTYVDGRITTASLSWELWTGGAPVTLSAAASGLRVDGEAVTLTELEGRIFGGEFAMSLRIAYPVGDEGMRTPTGTLRLSGAREGFGKWIRDAAGLSRVPTGLTLDGELETDASGVLKGPIVLSNPRSRLTLGLSLGSLGEIDGSVLGGEVSLSDLYELLPRGGPTVVGKGSVEVQAPLEGTWMEPEATLKLFAHAPRLMIAFGKGVRVALGRILMRGRANLQRFVWSELVIDAWDGRVKSQGLFGWSHGFRGLQAKLEVDDVSLGALPLPGGGKVGAYVAGRLNGTATFKQKAGESLGAKGSIWIDSPVYPALTLAEPQLDRYRLKPPPIRGLEPMMADLRGGQEGWMLRSINGAVRGASVEGDLALVPSGQLLGSLELALEAAYLRTSPILRVPATMVGDVKVPIHVRGPASSPEWEADLLGVLDHLVAKSRLGRGIHRAVDRVMDGVLGTEGRRHEVADDAERLDSDVLIQRIADGSDDEDHYLDVLIDRGLDPMDIADRIEAARRR